MLCSGCAGDVPEDDLFCEGCGRRVALEPAAACDCGVVDEDGFCEQCGRRVVRPASDHVEVVVSHDCAGVSDRGLRHDRNEDRFAMVAAGDGVVMVVCDGVSATRQSEVASGAVAEAMLASLAAAVTEPVQAMREAIAAGVASVGALTVSKEESSASTTVVAALVVGGMATVGWVGDSRAYWVEGGQARLLTRDHSWMNEVVSAGEMTLEAAARSPQAHAITRWIGADAEDAVADVVQVPVNAGGLLMLCTDGLWNYAQTDDVLSKVLMDAGAESGEAIEMVRRLVQFANGAGGQDNVTVALMRAG